MDHRQVFINILKDMQTNLSVVLQFAQQPNHEPIQERFYRWIREPYPLTPEEEVPIVLTGNQSVQRMVDAVHCFVQVVTDQVAKGQTVDGCLTRLTQLREDRERMENKLHKLKVLREQQEETEKFECQSRLDVINDLQIRLKNTEEDTSKYLFLAKECGEAARNEWEINNQKPLEEQRLHYELLGAQFNTMLKENAHTEDQLKKCRDERNKEIETVTTKMKADISQRTEEIESLRRQVSEESAHLEELQESLATITIQYDAIMEKRRKEEEEELKRIAEERARERAAIRIQRWFRFYLFRTMRARKRRKKAKRKVSKEVRKDPIEESSKTPQRPGTQQQQHDGASNELRTPVAVMVSRKSVVVHKPISPDPSAVAAEHAPLTPSSETDGVGVLHDKASKKNKPKKPVSAIQSITVKKNKARDAKTTPTEKEVKENPITSLNRSSQTDNRVPRSKQVFR